MPNSIIVNKKVRPFIKKISVSGDKSLSIRWILFSSLSKGICKAKNLLISEDIIATIQAIKKLGIKVILKKNSCVVFGKGINGFKYKKNIIINGQNSGTLSRLILGLLVNSNEKIKIIGDRSLSRRDFRRISDPLVNLVQNLN